jgi:hypothetical protein
VEYLLAMPIYTLDRLKTLRAGACSSDPADMLPAASVDHYPPLGNPALGSYFDCSKSFSDYDDSLPQTSYILQARDFNLAAVRHVRICQDPTSGAGYHMT